MENETTKLLNVMRRIAKAAGYAQWIKAEPEATRFCVSQFNRVLARLTELEPASQSLFTPLSEDASGEVIRIAAREVLAYFEADAPEMAWHYERPFYFRGRPRRARIRCITIPTCG